MPSFDLVSKLDMGEMKNALNQAERMISGRYDFKGSVCSFKFIGDKELELVAEDDYKMKAALDILLGCMSKRGIGLRGIDPQEITPSGLKLLKQRILIRSGIDKEHGKLLNKIVKDSKLKVTSAYIDEKLRISGKKIDDLQEVYKLLRTHKDVDIDLSMENMKS